MKEIFWISSTSMTVEVITVNRKIVGGPPIVGKFIGQPVTNLIYWMKKTKQGQILTYKLFDDGRETEEAKFE
jgi:hypothetical protein